MEDYIVRAIAGEESVRAFVAVTTSLVEESRKIHDTSPVATAALGRTLTAGAIMGAMLKGEKDTVTIQIKGRGELGGIVAVSDSKSNVRGYVHNPQVDIPLKSNGKLDVSRAIGGGYLNIVRDMGLKEPYVGQIPLVSGEIAEDLAYYFTQSEQINSVVGLGVLIERDYTVSVSGGFIIQVLPGVKESIISRLEENVKEINSVSALFKKYITPEEVLKYLLRGFKISITDKTPTKYLCTCSRERIEGALIGMGKRELVSLIEEQGEAELSCHFCNLKYHFTKDQLIEIMNESTK